MNTRANQIYATLRPFAIAIEHAAADLVSPALAGYDAIGRTGRGVFSWDTRLRASRETRYARTADAMIATGFVIRRAWVHGKGYAISHPSPSVQEVIASEIASDDSDVWRGIDSIQFKELLLLDGMIAVRIAGDGGVTAVDIDELDPGANLYSPSDTRRVWLHRRDYDAQRLRGGAVEVYRKSVYHPDLSFWPSPSTAKVLDSFANANGATILWDEPMGTWTVGDGMPIAHVAVRWARCVETMLAYELVKHRVLSSIPGAIRAAADAIDDIGDALETHAASVEDVAASLAVIDGQMDVTNISVAMLRPENIEAFERRIIMVFGMRKQFFGIDEPAGLNSDDSQRNAHADMVADDEQQIYGEIYASIMRRRVIDAGVSRAVYVEDVVDATANDAIELPRGAVTYTRKRLVEPLVVDWPEPAAVDVSSLVAAIRDAVTLGKAGEPIIGTPRAYWGEVVRLLRIPDQGETLESLEGLTWADIRTGAGSVEARLIDDIAMALEAERARGA